MASLITLRASSVQNVFRFSLAKFIVPTASSRNNLHTTYLLNVKGIPINMPALSPTMSEGTIVKWLKKEGDPINPGDALCDIQTDKAVMAMETEEQGILAKIILGNDSKDIKIGTLIGLMVEEGQDWKAVEMPAGVGAAAAAPSPAKTPAPKAPTPTPAPAAVSSKAGPSAAKAALKSAEEKIGPAVRSLLNQYGLKSSGVKATGPKNLLLKGDVLKHIKDNKLSAVVSKVAPPSPSKSSMPSKPSKPSKAPTPAASKVTVPPGAKYIDIPVSNMRNIIAKRLLESKVTIPHAYAAIDCIVDGILTLRKEMKKENKSVSMNDFVVKAVALALQRIPAVNVQWAKDTIKQVSEIDVAVAVATETGLITPIVKGPALLTVEQIGATVKDLAKKAREGKLKPHEFQGGSFTISNLGMFGVTQFTAIINPPQAAILAVGCGRETFNEYMQIRNRMTVNLSYDARAVDEDSAAQFLQAFRDYMENPNLMMTGIPDSRMGIHS